jgi:hypothetical protein
MHECRDVQVDHLIERVDVSIEQACRPTHARVVDQSGDTGVRVQYLLHTVEMRTVVQVGSDDLDGAPSVSAKARRKCFEAFSATGNENEIVTSSGQPIRANGTNA